MGIARRNRRKMKRVNSPDPGKLITLIDGFVEAGYLMIDTLSYHIAMLDNFWSLYATKERQVNLLNNLKFYCNIMNAYHNKPVVNNVAMIVSLKDEEENVEPVFYYKDDLMIQIEK
ncbi:MAG: hypothetical protein VB054_04825 [Petrimonas sp.]|nr:hypothetical protein [Petrimonas sp.]